MSAYNRKKRALFKIFDNVNSGPERACPAGFVDGTNQFTLNATGAQGGGYGNHLFHHGIRALIEFVGPIGSRKLISRVGRLAYRLVDKNAYFSSKCQIKTSAKSLLFRAIFLEILFFWRSCMTPKRTK